MVPNMNSYWKKTEEKKEGKEAGAGGSTREEKERGRSRRTNDFKALSTEQCFHKHAQLHYWVKKVLILLHFFR